jgi:hypothetical protein
MTTHLYGFTGIGAAFVKDPISGVVSLTSGVPISTQMFPPSSILGVLVTDTDTVYAPVAVQDRFLAPTNRVLDTDTIHLPTVVRPGATQTLTPASRHLDADTFYIHDVHGEGSLLLVLFNDTDVFYIPAIANVIKGKAKQELTVTVTLTNDDVIYPASMRTGTLSPLAVTDADVVYAPVFTVGPVSLLPQRVTDTDIFVEPFVGKVLQPQVVASDDNVYAPTMTGRYVIHAPTAVIDQDVFYTSLFSMIVQPPLAANDDNIPVADVGWQVITEFTPRDDAVYAVEVKAYNELLPEEFADEEHIDTYPFFVQAVSGGIPVEAPPDVLKGNVKKQALTGNIKTRQALTGKVGRRAA